MQAKETRVKFLVEGNRQFLVPLYQRRYAWKPKDWESFWVAVKRQYLILRRSKSSPTHFFGSLVVHPKSDQASGLASYNIIDGQQRLTTVMVLLVVIRDLWGSAKAVERINDFYLVNKYEDGWQYLRLLPGVHDRDDFKALLDGDPAKATGSIGAAYRWLRNEVEILKAGGDFDLPSLELAVTTRLEVVDITCDASDNAHRIFQTLNSTGRSLSQVDLLRNHFFMLLPTRSDDAFDKHWGPMESRLGSWIDMYLWVWTVSQGKGRETIPRDRVYDQWQRDLASVEDQEQVIYDNLSDLASGVVSFAAMIDPTKEVEDQELQRQLSRLVDWGTNVHYPVTFQIMERVRKKTLSADSAIESLRYVESFMVRRMLAGYPTNNLNRIFTTTAGQMANALSYAPRLRKALSSPGKAWPTDDELRAQIIVHPFYNTQRTTQRQYVLRRLEEAMPGKELPDWKSTPFTIEHVMPQNLNEDWFKVLKDSGEAEPATAHQELLHTLGNTTLTSENSALSNHPLERKQSILESSLLKMNKLISATHTWDRAAIVARSGALAETAISIWPEPSAESDDDSEDWTASINYVLGFMPDNMWVAIDDLAEVVEVGEVDVRQYLVSAKPDGSQRVLKSDGSPDLSLPWVKSNLTDYRTTLVGLGILDDTDSLLAPSSRRITRDELGSLLTSQA